jgi:SAM-dependent methyltransferase
MGIGIDSRSISAKYYDQAYASDEDLVDLPFYLDLARQSGGPVLELGCGTGRVLLPIARAGVQSHGLDNSLPMLNVLRRRLESETDDVRARVSVFEGDVRDFRSQQKYSLVTLPFRVLQHMHTVEDQIAALQTAAFHLHDRGLLAFDVYYPRFERLGSGVGQELLELEWRSEPDTVVKRHIRKESHDKINQNFTFTFIFRTFRAGKMIQEETEPLRMSYYTYPHLRALFKLACLEIAEEYGSFAKAPLNNDAAQMVFVLKKAA